MINLHLTQEQALALHDALTQMNLEPMVIDGALLNNFNPTTDHPLWPVLDTLRQQIQIELFSFVNALHLLPGQTLHVDK